MADSVEYGNEGLGLADAAGLVPGQDALNFNFFESFGHYFQNDLISSIPISICSFLVLFAIIERGVFYNKNNRDISSFIQRLQGQLEKGDLEGAQMLSAQMGSVIGEVAEEGVRLLAVKKEDFGKAYDITVNIVIRKLEKYLPILATVGAIAPFLGLFGTVSGVIKALFKMALGAEGASLTMVGEISNALIATGYGLFIAILAVVFNNIFNNIVKRYEDDFLLLKLLFLSFAGVDFASLKNNHAAVQAQQQQAVHHQDMQAQQQAPQMNNPHPQQQQGGGAHEAQGMAQQQQGNNPSYPDFLS